MRYLLLSLSMLVPAMSMISLNTKISSPQNGSQQQQQQQQPLTILVHGLDSSSKTWDDTMEHLDSPSVAIDQRGSGYSALGNPADFSQKTLVEDLHRVVVSHTSHPAAKQKNARKVVLLGHSLGGRIVLGYAASYPERVSALIIEDMDIAERMPDANGFVKLQPYDGVFDRQRATKDLMVRALADVGYPPDFIEKALSNGRIEPNPNADPPGSTWWSHVNPDFRKLCYRHVLSTPQGRQDCQRIASFLSEEENKKDTIGFPIHVLVAGQEGTVCIEESIQEMKTIFGDRLNIHRYPEAGHSIHSSAPEKFRETVKSIINHSCQLDSVGE